MLRSLCRRIPETLLATGLCTAYAGYATCADAPPPTATPAPSNPLVAATPPATSNPVAASKSTTTSTTSTPSRGDAIAKGDRLILNADVPIFVLDPRDGGDGKTIYCAPARSKIEIESAPTTTTTTATKSAGGTPANVTTTNSGSQSTVETASRAAGDTTTTTTQTLATAIVDRVGPRYFRGPSNTCMNQPGLAAAITAESLTVKPGTTYSFNPSDLDRYRTERFGLTYGVVVVPNKVMIADRAFISSSSVLPYVGYEAWGPSWAGAAVFAAGVGTAPASTQTPASSTTGPAPGSGSGSTSSSSSTGTKATFSVAAGIVGALGGTFKIGLLIGVDTAGSNTGFKYQGKPWIGISLGAGSQ